MNYNDIEFQIERTEPINIDFAPNTFRVLSITPQGNGNVELYTESTMTYMEGSQEVTVRRERKQVIPAAIIQPVFGQWNVLTASADIDPAPINVLLNSAKLRIKA